MWTAVRVMLMPRVKGLDFVEYGFTGMGTWPLLNLRKNNILKGNRMLP